MFAKTTRWTLFIVGWSLCHTVAANEWHVSPDGTARGDGSRQAPWDLATALAATERVAAGDTVWLHGGTYRGGFESRLTGNADAPVTVRHAAGERATIDCRPRDAQDNGLFAVSGDHTPEVEVDLGDIVPRGQEFKIVSAQDSYGEPVMSGRYDGPVKLPMRPRPGMLPIGRADFVAPPTEPEFGAYVVLSVR
jgi:hypothetical protein